MDQHAAVGYLALKKYQSDLPDVNGIILETAHPAKFLEDVEQILGNSIEVPKRLADLRDLEKQATQMPANFDTFKNWLLAYA